MYAVLGNRALKLISCSILLVAVFLAEASLISHTSEQTDIRKPKARAVFLTELGVLVDESSLTETAVTIPSVFSDVYSKYNELQRQAGYNLEDYKGKTVTRYTYKLKDKEHTNINILCYKGKVIGGDISETALDGKMLPLKTGDKNGTNATG